VTVTVVLDTSAVIAYTKASVAVGELLSIITDDGDTALVPATCLAEAHRRLTGGDEALLSILSNIPCVEHAPLSPDQASDVGMLARRGGGIDLGHAAAMAVAHQAQLVSQDVLTMSRLLPPDWPILEV
jgi:predicted nucleic acid-binding protein